MTQDESVSFEAVAKHFDRTEPVKRDAATILQGKTFELDGFGSIGRPVGEGLARLGAPRLIMTDPKHYRPQSVLSQCTLEEVGRLKVDVGAERLRELGAEVTAFPRDLASVPEGVVTPDTIVITTVDNRRADIVSNRRAARMGARMIKVNVEPALEVAAVRAYDFRRETSLCVECQFSGHHYAAQRHPKSCDGSIDGRSTNSPPWLSQAAAHLGVLAALDLAEDRPAAADWLGHEWQYLPRTGVVNRSRLEPKPNCRWDHARRWQNVVKSEKGADSISLRELIQAAKFGVDARTHIRFCQQIALGARCRNCQGDVAIVRWFTDLQSPVGTCPHCDGQLLSIPFATFSAISLEPLLTVLDQPLNQWGVEQFAVIELSRLDRHVTFVVGRG